MARTLLEVIGLGDLEHGANDIQKLVVEKARLSASELDEELEGLLGGGLIAGVEGLREGAHHGEEVAKVVAVSGRGEALDEVGGVEGGDSNIGGRGVEEGGEDGAKGGEVGEKRIADVLGQLREDEERRFLKVGIVGGDGLEHEGRSFGQASSRRRPAASSETMSQSFLAMDLTSSCWTEARRDLSKAWEAGER